MFKYQPTWLFTVLLTWAAVAFPSLFHASGQTVSYLEYVLHGLFLLFTLFVVNESTRIGFRIRYAVLACLIAVLCGLFFISEVNLILIYSVMLCSILVFYVPAIVCYGYIFTIHGIFLISHALYWQQGWLWADAAMFTAFHFFALVVTQRMQSERHAKEQLALTNAKLEATQSLLSTAAEQSERLKLARDLHDDVGHALTSLIINLDIARRTSNEEQQPQLQACYEQAKQALQTTRSVVSDKRDNVGFNLADCLHKLAQQTPRIQIQLEVVQHLDKVQLDTAQCLLKCTQEAITNTLKHAPTATCMKIQLEHERSELVLSISDDGVFKGDVVYGNGLKGMQERVSLLAGQLSLVNSKQGFTLIIRVPYE
ncbi:histidine kinase [Pseudoalteromonas sp. MMG022]|uniref:sensor histidine kinase n=1 Tax=Pseudoalteromonas sp. MMG022 TaxID=2909978 RepID=UPI001EFF7053|nr:histidine kinase [Pseudoalteromonas sp. MMG022]MCF6437269.1 histidine kinase [Pseudoalteromonas sp. MMG022]